MNLLIIFAAKYLFVVIILIAVLYAVKVDAKVRKQLLLLTVISLPLSFIIAKIGSHFFFNPRPFVVEHIKPLIAHAADNGFPSDHTLISAAVAAVIFVFSRKLGLVLFFLTVLVGGARILAHIHHPIDVIGSIVIASVATGIVWYFLKLKTNNTSSSTV